MDKSSKDSFLSQSIAIATATFYPNWHPGKSNMNHTDKIRGDLALNMIKKAKNKGFQIIVVDDSDNKEFKDNLIKAGIKPYKGSQKGMSQSRQEAFKKASKINKVRVICWLEPEKVSVIEDCLPKAVLPILEGKTDIIVPRRNDRLFTNTYPDYQVKFEKENNRIWNELLKKYGIGAANDTELDVWFGPRFFINNPKIVSIFTDQYVFKADSQKELDKIIQPELWPNAVFFPIIVALHKGLRVMDLEIPYKHPLEQMHAEKDNNEFREKRKFQQKSILLGSEFFIRMLLHLETKGGKIEKTNI